MDDIFNSPDGDYVEELVDSEGHHTRKEVHTGQGYKTVTITSDTPLALNEVLSQMFGGIPNDFPMHLEGDSLIEAMN